MIESISEFSFWQLLIATINFIAFIYIIVYLTSKAFFSAYYESKEKYNKSNSNISDEVFSLIKKEVERLDQLEKKEIETEIEAKTNA